MWSLGIPAALRDGTIGCRKLRHNGKGSLLPEKQTKNWLYGISGRCVPQGRPTLVGDHRYVTSFPSLDLNKQEEG